MTSSLEKVYSTKSDETKKGGSYKVGGLADLKGYSVLSKAKRNLIRDISKDVAEQLKLKVDPKEKDVQKLIAQLKKEIPDPRPQKGNRKTYQKDKRLHESLCQVLAKILNKNLGGKVVDPKMKAPEVCEQAWEVLNSLFVGMHAEFLVVKKDVEQSLKNLRALRQFLKASYDRLVNSIKREPSINGAEVRRIQAVHEALLKEIDRQLTLLESMLNVTILPSEQSLIQVLTDHKEYGDLIAAIRSAPGAGAFGEKISFVLSGINTVALMAYEVDKALKKLGMSVKEYEATKSMDKLQHKINKTIQKALKKSTTNELMTMLEAKKVIEAHDYRRNDIVDYLKKQASRAGKKVGGKETKKKTKRGGLKLDKRIKERKVVRQQLLRSFNQQLRELYERVLTSTEILAKKMGKDLPLSDALSKFVKAFEAVPDIGDRNMYYALTGYQGGIHAKEIRERFTNSVRHLIGRIDDLLKKKDYQKAGQLRDVRDALEASIRLIEDYADRFAKGFSLAQEIKKIGAAGVGETTKKVLKTTTKIPAIVEKSAQFVKTSAQSIEQGASKVAEAAAAVQNRSDNVKTELPKTGDIPTAPPAPASKMGSSQHGKLGAGALGCPDISMPEITKLAYSLNKAKNELSYYHRVAQIYDNLEKAAKELPHYGEDYDKLLGDAIAERIDNLMTQRKDKDKELSGAKDNKSLFEALGGNSPNADQKKQKSMYQKLCKQSYDARKAMYKTVEAVDKYLQAFTDALVSNPQDLKEVQQMLEDTEIISKWFTSKTGDYLCAAMDEFPGHLNNKSEPRYNNINDEKWQYEHYYKKVEVAADLSGAAIQGSLKNTLPGNPLLGIPITSKDDRDHIRNANNYVCKTVDNLAVLKNIISTVITIGDRFGGEELRKKTHMTPYQIYKNLTLYLKSSAFVSGLENEQLPATNLSVADVGGQAVGLGGTFKSQNTIRVGILNEDPLAPVTKPEGPLLVNAKSAVAMNSVLPNSPYSDEYAETDELFVLAVKALVAKVLTTIGVFNVFNKPIAELGPHELLSDTRVILGGADLYPKVIPEAIELYIRLPLLAEFYRTIFQLESDAEWKQTDQKISLVPEFEGTFSDLIYLIFDKTQWVKDGTYSETDIKAIVEAINKIYLHFKDSKDLVSAVINEFVAEVNRRYGVLSREDREKYIKSRDAMRDSDLRPTEESIDFEILPGGEDDEYQRPAPSDKYLAVGADLATKGHSHKLEVSADQRCVRVFREAIEKEFQKVQQTQKSTPELITFENIIQAKAEELRYARDDKEKFDVVVSAINGFGSFAISAAERTMLLFHETVVTGLNTLSATYSLLERTREEIKTMNDVIEKARELPKKVTANQDLSDLIQKLSADEQDYMSRGTVVESGRQGLPTGANDLTINDMVNLAATHAGANDEMKKMIEDVVQRFVVRQGHMLQKLIEVLFGYDSDLTKLVDIKMDEHRIHLDHSKMRDRVETLFRSTKDLIAKFRGVLPKKLIEKYECLRMVGATEENKGSLYWIEKHLINELLHGKVARGEDEDKNIEKSNAYLKNIMDFFTKEWSFDARDVTNNTLANPTGTVKKHEFDRELAWMILFDYTKAHNEAPNGTPFQAGILGDERTVNVTGDDKLHKLLQNDAGDAPRSDDVGSRIAVFYDASSPSINKVKSLVILFNQILANYLLQFYEDTSEKIYLPVINNFANGAFSGPVTKKDETIPDTGSLGAPSITLIAGDNGTGTSNVLLRSLAHVLRNLLTVTKKATTNKRYIETDLAEIPLFMQEKYRANMPIFTNMLYMLMRKCEMVKQMLKSLNIRNEREHQRLNGLLDKVIQGSQSLVGCMNEVLRELEDTDPRYMETYKDFIKDYKTLNGRNPLMPYSSLLYLLRDGQYGADNNAALPFSGLGNSKFKLMYGSRLVLSRPTEMVRAEHVPGLRDIVQMHNESVDARYHFEMSDLEKYLLSSSDLLRYIVYSRQLRGEMTQLVNNQGNVANSLGIVQQPLTDALVQERVVYSLDTDVSLEDVISITESSFQEDSRRNITNRMVDMGQNIMRDGRDKIRVYNLIDLNIMPINVHALMREIPLINVYNYAHTFDKMVCDLFGVRYQDTTETARDAKTMMGILLLRPYAPINDAVYRGKVERLFRGDTGLDLGRPRFLGDEVFNKCLFGELYSGPIDWDEAGPGVGAGHNRGRNAAPGQLPHQQSVVGMGKQLSYLKEAKEGDLASLNDIALVTVAGWKKALQVHGKLRFDTKLVRNIFWLTNIQRALRLKLRNELTWYDSKVIRSSAVASPELTELYANNVDQEYLRQKFGLKISEPCE